MDDARARGRRPLLAVLAAFVVATAVWLVAANAFGAGRSGDRPATSPGAAQTQKGGDEASPVRARGGSAGHDRDGNCRSRGVKGFEPADV